MNRNENVLAPTFDDLCAIEPGLRALHDLARAVRDDRRSEVFCANYLWYGALKPRLVELVGWYANWRVWPNGKPELLVQTLDEFVDEENDDGATLGLPHEVELIRSDEAYSVAYEVIYRALPDCRNCTCI